MQQIEKGTINFTVGHGLDNLVRQAYWFENRQEWALKVLDCLKGITMEQKMAVLNGYVQLVPVEGGRKISLVQETDIEFRKTLTAHRKWREDYFYKISGKWIAKKHVDQYIKFVVYRYRLAIYRPSLFASKPEIVMRMEEIRVGLHDRIIWDAGFKERKGHEYNKFEFELSKMVDKEADKWKKLYKVGRELETKGVYNITADDVKERIEREYGI